MDMVNLTQKNEDIMLSCDANGIIKEVSCGREDYIYNFFQQGEFFLKNVDPDSLAKSLKFFTNLKKAKIVTNYEINFVFEKNVATYILSGAHLNNDFLVLLTAHQIYFDAFDEMMIINNEQANMFRKVIKESMGESLEATTFEFDYFDEISKLNNELMNAQRELAKKNSELNQLNIRLEELTIRDSLTNLFNKRYLYTKFEEEVVRSSRFQYPISIVMIDLNDFKLINDQQGHNEGDRILIQFAEICCSNTRDGLDYVFRIGGDEFLILMTHCEAVTAYEVLERINKEYIKTNTVSSVAFGIASFIGDKSSNLDDIVTDADNKMYEHKRSMKANMPPQ